MNQDVFEMLQAMNPNKNISYINKFVLPTIEKAKID